MKVKAKNWNVSRITWFDGNQGNQWRRAWTGWKVAIDLEKRLVKTWTIFKIFSKGNSQRVVDLTSKKTNFKCLQLPGVERKSLNWKQPLLPLDVVWPSTPCTALDRRRSTRATWKRCVGRRCDAILQEWASLWSSLWPEIQCFLVPVRLHWRNKNSNRPEFNLDY